MVSGRLGELPEDVSQPDQLGDVQGTLTGPRFATMTSLQSCGFEPARLRWGLGLCFYALDTEEDGSQG